MRLPPAELEPRMQRALSWSRHVSSNPATSTRRVLRLTVCSVSPDQYDRRDQGVIVTSNGAFFKESKQAQSALKHAILRKYLATFAGATGTNAPGHRVGFIDGYAGPGTYLSEGGIERDGSPSIALTIAQNQLATNRHLECIFVEKRPKLFARLEQLTHGAQTPALALSGDVAGHLKPALAQFANIPVLVFLDPFGASLDRDSSIDSILKRGGDQPTELLLNFSLQTIRRAGPLVRKPLGTVGREATLATMNRWLGGDWWQDIFLDPSINEDEDRADRAANLVASGYAERVQRSTGCSVFGVAMRRRPTHKALFSLMLFHPRPLAAFKYNDAVSLAQESWRETMWGRDIEEAELMDELTPRLGLSYADEMREVAKADKAQFKLDAISTIEDAIVKTLSSQPAVSVEKEFGKVFGHAAGEGRGLHLRAAWKNLAERGVAIPVPKGDLDKATIRRANSPSAATFR